MLHELCIPLTMKAMAFGHPLCEAQCIAAMLILQLVLLCTLMGFCIIPPEENGRPDFPVFPGRGRVSLLRICGILPVPAGTAGDTRAVLHQ